MVHQALLLHHLQQAQHRGIGQLVLALSGACVHRIGDVADRRLAAVPENLERFKFTFGGRVVGHRAPPTVQPVATSVILLVAQ